MTAERMLNVAEVADRLRCSYNTVLLEIGRNNLRATKVAGRWLISPADLAAYIDAGYNVKASA